MKGLLTGVVVTLGICYPFIVYYGLKNFEAKWMLPVIMLALAFVRYVLDKTTQRKLILITLLVLCISMLFIGEQTGVKFYPVMMNIAFFALFAGSLFTDRSFVERLARLKEEHLPPEAIKYTRNVTIIWSIFFVVNGSIACFTVFCTTDEIWMLYNGIIAYILMGILGAGEWLVRKQVKKA
jgi:uncharacterized membrane protein